MHLAPRAPCNSVSHLPSKRLSVRSPARADSARASLNAHVHVDVERVQFGPRREPPHTPQLGGAVGFGGLCKGPPSRLGICHGRAPTAAAHHYTHPDTVPASPLNGAGCAVRHVKASHELQPLHGPRSERCHCHHVPHQNFAIRRVRACGKAARHSAAAHALNTLSHALSSRTRKAFAKAPPALDHRSNAPHYFPIPHSRARTFDAGRSPQATYIESGLTPFAHDGSGVRAPYPACWTGGLNKVRPLAEMCSTAQLRSICVSFFFRRDPGRCGHCCAAGGRSVVAWLC